MFDLIPWTRRDNNLWSFMDDMEKNFFSMLPSNMMASAPRMRADIADEGDHYLLSAELPGFDKDDIKIDVADNILTISAEHREESESNDKNYLRRERRYGTFSRSFDVSNISAEHIRAAYKNGVLSLELPKKETRQQLPSRQIEIQ